MPVMDYNEAREAFFSPREGQARDLGWSTPARRLRDAIEPVAALSFWSKDVNDRYAERGLDFLLGYVWGRSCVLGEPEPGVVAAAFGVFEPGLVAQLYTDARAAVPLAEIRAAKEEGLVATLHDVLGDPAQAEGLAETTAALQRSTTAVPLLGRPFFAALSTGEVPADPWAALWHACTVLRELRGDVHLAACVAAGLDGIESNVMTELWVGWEPLAYTGTRAWAPEAMDAAMATLAERGLVEDGGAALSGKGRDLREEIERITDDAMAVVVDSLGDDLDAVVGRVGAWSDRIVEAGWFPPDPYKRAAG